MAQVERPLTSYPHELDPLKTLIAIAEHGSFVAAARSLPLSQSAVSRHVQALEHTFGQHLFDRSTWPPTLTAEGMACVARAKDLLALAEQFVTPAGRVAVEGCLNLGAVGSVLTGILPVPGAAMRRIIDRAVGKLRLDVCEGMRLDWLEAIETMVRRGHGIAIVPERLSAPPVGVRRLSLGEGSFNRTLGLIEATRNRKRRLTDTVIAELRAGAAQYGAAKGLAIRGGVSRAGLASGSAQARRDTGLAAGRTRETNFRLAGIR